MTTPLYQEHKASKTIPDNGHAGLWFERFFNHYSQEWSIDKEAKSKWIKTVTGKRGQTEQLEKFNQRQQSLVHSLKGQSHLFKADWHMVTGMGNPHPVENGFSWHPTLAVPYLSGSTVKGLVRSWVELNDEELQGSENKQRLLRWFGTNDKKEVPEQSGAFIFFDAIPENQPTLICDIMTPHMGKWYQNENGSKKPEDIPADWHEPVPISFLAVKQSQFIFSIAPRNKKDKAELPLVFDALENALNWLGVGAKTATGYGYMTKDTRFFENNLEKLQQQAEEQVKQMELEDKLKDCTPLAQEYFTQVAEQSWEQNKDSIWQKGMIEQWLDKLEQQENSEKQILDHLIAIVELYFPGLIANPDKTKGKGKKAVFKDRQKQVVARIKALQKKA